MQRRNEETGQNEYFYPITHKDAIVGMEELTANYLPLNGGTLTGPIEFNYNYNYGEVGPGFFLRFNDASKSSYGYLQILDNSQPLKDRVRFFDCDGSKQTAYNIYGEHNKPTPEDIGAVRNNPACKGGDGGVEGYVAFAQLKVIDTYADRPIVFELAVRSKSMPSYVCVKFVNINGFDPDIEYLTYWGAGLGLFAQKIDTSTWVLYHQKNGSWGDITVTQTLNPETSRIQITYPGTFVTTRPTANIKECSGTTAMITGTLPVSQGGTGATSFTSGAVLIGNGTGAITTRGITNNTSGSQSISGNTNLITLNTLRCVVNRDNGVHVADTNYTTSMARGIALTTSTPSLANGTCAFVYA